MHKIEKQNSPRKIQDIMPYFRYYHGEDVNPFSSGQSDAGYWRLERNYIHEYLQRGDYWETEGVEMCLEFDEIREIFTSDKYNKAEKGMLASFAIIGMEQSPESGLDYLLGYGKVLE